MLRLPFLTHILKKQHLSLKMKTQHNYLKTNVTKHRLKSLPREIIDEQRDNLPWE